MLLASSWLDYVAAIGTAIGALAAAGAVIVALFAPGWREKRKRPKLTVTQEGSELSVDALTESATEMRVRIHNARGRDTAEAVEVFVTVTSGRPGRGGTVIVAQDENL